ncbi:MAG: ABC transporter substrate-binding protein [Desulfobacterales bacterium]|nr:ABC transporter substrate-binding protein [Desulfobacterales bacterium]
MKKNHLLLISIQSFFYAILCVLLLICKAMPICANDSILLGQSCALEGQAKELGINMRDGAMLYFSHINNQGGIHGKNIKLISYNDSYEPDTCIQQTQKLIKNDNVFLLFGYVGTPTSKVAVPIAEENKIPFFAPFSGAEFLRTPINRYIFNIRGSYYQETDAMVDRLINEKDIKRISVFYQDDAYGQAGFDGVQKALQKRGLQIWSKATYPRNTLEIDKAIEIIHPSQPGAIIMVGAYQPCAEFIKKIRDAGNGALLLNLSFVGADKLGELLKNKGLGVVITQVVPFPHYKKIPIVAEYNSLLKKYTPDSLPNYVGMEGFIASKILCNILQTIEEPINQEKFIQAAERHSDEDLGGFSYSFSPTNHQGSTMVDFSQIGPGGFIAPLKHLKHLYKYGQ